MNETKHYYNIFTNEYIWKEIRLKPLTGSFTFHSLVNITKEKKTKRQSDPKATSSGEHRSEHYCVIDETNMRAIGRPSTMEHNTVNTNTTPDTHANQIRHHVCKCKCSDEVSPSQLNREEHALGNEAPLYENGTRSTHEDDDTDGNSSGSSVSVEKPTNTNYISLDPAPKESSCPPSVYIRLKGGRFTKNPTGRPVQSFQTIDDFECCNCRPKLPTPESSSLSGNSTWCDTKCSWGEPVSGVEFKTGNSDEIFRFQTINSFYLQTFWKVIHLLTIRIKSYTFNKNNG